MIIKQSLLLLLPLLIPLLSPALGLLRKDFGKYLSLGIYAAGLVLALMLFPGILNQSEVLRMGGWSGRYAINLMLSPLSLGAIVVFYAMSLVIQAVTFREEKKASYQLLINLFLFAAIALVMTADLFNMFVMMELGSIASIALIGFTKKAEASRTGFLYMLMSSLAALLMLAGLAIVYSATGQLNIAVLMGQPAMNTALALLSGLLIVGVVFLHSEVLPFGIWVAPVYDAAPVSFTATLAGVGSLAGGVILLKVFNGLFQSSLFEGAAGSIKTILFILAVISVLFGELSALKEKNLKKLLAYSSIAQMGLVGVAVSIGGKPLVEAALFILFAHSFIKPLLLLISGHFAEIAGSRDYRDMTGLGRLHPLLTVLFIVGGLSLMGIPLFLGFWGKFGLLLGLVEGVSSSMAVMSIAALVILLISFIIEGTYLMKVAHSFFEEGSAENKARPNVVLSISGVILGTMVLVGGILPGLITPIIQGMSLELLNVSRFIQTILTGGTL